MGKKLPERLDDLPAADYNPRTMQPKNKRALKHSLYVFGDLSGIVFNTGTGHLVGGHQRKEGLDVEELSTIEWGEPYDSGLGEEEARFVSTERMGWFTTDDGTRFVVRMVDWPQPFEKAANLAANSPLLQGEWDFEKLAVIIPELQVELPTLSAELEIGGLLPDGYAPPAVVEVPPPAVQAEAVSKAGDLWLLGEHRLLCGDCTDAGAIDRLLDGEQADGFFADPPYNVGIQYGEGQNDNLPPSEYTDWLAGWFGAVWERCSGTLLVTPGIGNLDKWLGIRKPDGVIAWVKMNGQSRTALLGTNKWEPVLGYRLLKDRDIDVIQANTDRLDGLGDEHPVPKPLRLLVKLVERFVPMGGIVLEFFTGSGTTLIACEQLHRRCYAIEIEPRYVDVAIRRWQTLTGGEATHAQTEKTFADLTAERTGEVAPAPDEREGSGQTDNPPATQGT